MNCGDEQQDVALARFDEGIGQSSQVKNILTGESLDLPERVVVKGKQTLVFELK